MRGLPYGSHPASCPVRAWLAASGIDTGPAFRAVDRHGRLGTRRLSDRAVADMVKRRAAAAGLDGAFAAHSLHAGFATEGYAAGTPNWPCASDAGAPPCRLVFVAVSEPSAGTSE